MEARCSCVAQLYRMNFYFRKNRSHKNAPL